MGNKQLSLARDIMYHNLISMFPDVTVISDHLQDEAYLGTWDSDGAQLILYTFCDHIFDHGADIMITPV